MCNIARYTVASHETIIDAPANHTQRPPRDPPCGAVRRPPRRDHRRRLPAMAAVPSGTSLASPAREMPPTAPSCRRATVGAAHAQIENRFHDGVQIVPLLEIERGRLARRLLGRVSGGLPIGERRIDPGSPVFVIAEIGINHNGSLDVAKQLIDVAAEAEADVRISRCARPRLPPGNRSGAPGDHREDLGPQYTLDLLDLSLR